LVNLIVRLYLPDQKCVLLLLWESKMSYLSLPRLNFSGLFEADVNTVNNDVRNFDVATFEPRFQTAQEPAPDGKGLVYNGWWNPRGSNAFRLLECVVTGGVDIDGAAIWNDPVLALRIDTQAGRTSAKLVDLDPQFQFASAIWGMRFLLAAEGRVALSAVFRPACFRDNYFGRVAGIEGSPGASARFIGYFEEIVWGDAVASSPVLRAFHAMADRNEGRLAMSLLTYGYNKSPGTEGFKLGSVVGTIGPWRRGEPLTFAPGRRFAPLGGPRMPFASAVGLGYMNGAVSPDGMLLSLDFGNALPMASATSARGSATTGQPSLVLQDLGDLQIVVLKTADTVASGPGGISLIPSASDGAVLADVQFETIGELHAYDVAWLARTGGIVDFKIPEAARSLIGDHPIAILTRDVKGEQTIALRETIGGMWLRADDFVQRLDAAPTGWVTASVALYAMRFGAPYASAPISVTLAPEDNTAGGAGPNQVLPPQAEIPAINVPREKIRFPPELTADARGVALLSYSVLDPGTPRRYLDGQLYQLNYAIAATGQSPVPLFEMITVHVRDAFTPPASPQWARDIAPILIQYGNLYPIMSHGLFSFSDYDTVVANAHLLYLAFTRPIEDPNYMPATRDMSAGKMRMIIDWLASYLKDVPETYAALPVPPQGSTVRVPGEPVITGPEHPAHLAADTARAAAWALGPGNDGKTVAVRNYLEHQAEISDGTS
jgi:hypothetical protein